MRGSKVSGRAEAVAREIAMSRRSSVGLNRSYIILNVGDQVMVSSEILVCLSGHSLRNLGGIGAFFILFCSQDQVRGAEDYWPSRTRDQSTA